MDSFLDEEQGQQSRFDPLTLLRMFWRRKVLFFVPFVLCLAMAFVAVRTMTPIYESTGQIRVVYEVTNSDLLENSGGRYRRSRDLDREALATLWTIVTGPKFLQSVVLETQLQTGHIRVPQEENPITPEVLDAEEMEVVEYTANRLQRFIRVAQQGHHIFNISVRDPDPRRAFVLARVVLDKFLEEERATRVAPRTTTRDFLNRQRQTYAAALEAAEDSLANFQRTIMSSSLAGNPINASNLPAAESGLLRLQDQFYNGDVNEMARLEQQARSVVSTLPDADAIARDPQAATLVSDLKDLQLVGLLGERDGNLANDLGRARLRLNNLVDERVSRQYSQLGLMDRNRLTQYLYFMVFRLSKERAMNTLAGYIRDYRDFTTRQPVQSAHLADLQEAVYDRREMLENIDREIQQQTMNLEASMSEVGYRIEVRRDPRLQEFPVEPDKLRLYFMGFALSVALGFGLVVLSIMLDRTFTSVGEIEGALGVNVIGTLPVINDEHFKRKRRLRLLRWITIVVAVLVVAAVFLLYVYPRIT